MTGLSARTDEYSYIVIGSGLAALAFIDRTLRLDKRAQILCLEKGSDDVAAYHKQLVAQAESRHPTRSPWADVSPADRSWRLTDRTLASSELNECAGTCFVLGGRSNYWHGWCKQPEPWQMRDFPSFMLEAVKGPTFWDGAHGLLNTTPIEQLDDIHFCELQDVLDVRLVQALKVGKLRAELHPAVFAHGNGSSGRFSRFSVSEQLRTLQAKCRLGQTQRLDIWSDCDAKRLNIENPSRAVESLDTSKGKLRLAPSASVILCAGSISNAALALRSFPDLRTRIGRRFGGHFRSHVFARVPKSVLMPSGESDYGRKSWGVAAKVLTGNDQRTQLQYHIQLSLFYCPQYESRYCEIVSELPRYGTAPVEAQIDNLGTDILIACTALGELSSDAGDKWLRPGPAQDEAVELQFAMSNDEHSLWDTMDSAAFDIIRALVADERSLRYWDDTAAQWLGTRPTMSQRRSSVLVHEACTTACGGPADEAVVGEGYKLHGCENVYVTGAGLFPTAGGWNPALTVCGFAQHLAETIQSSKNNIVGPS